LPRFGTCSCVLSDSYSDVNDGLTSSVCAQLQLRKYKVMNTRLFECDGTLFHEPPTSEPLFHCNILTPGVPVPSRASKRSRSASRLPLNTPCASSVAAATSGKRPKLIQDSDESNVGTEDSVDEEIKSSNASSLSTASQVTPSPMELKCSDADDKAGSPQRVRLYDKVNVFSVCECFLQLVCCSNTH